MPPRPARRAGPGPGAIVTGTFVGTVKRGVLVDVGVTELLLPRSRFGAAADLIDALGYGDALTVEVVADPGQAGGVGLSRVAIERSVRQPRRMDGRLERSGPGCVLHLADGAEPFAVIVLDRSPDAVAVHEVRAWLVGAPHRGVRLLLPVD